MDTTISISITDLKLERSLSDILANIDNSFKNKQIDFLGSVVEHTTPDPMPVEMAEIFSKAAAVQKLKQQLDVMRSYSNIALRPCEIEVLQPVRRTILSVVLAMEDIKNIPVQRGNQEAHAGLTTTHTVTQKMANIASKEVVDIWRAIYPLFLEEDVTPCIRYLCALQHQSPELLSDFFAAFWRSV